jgi:hypothetical protein
MKKIYFLAKEIKCEDKYYLFYRTNESYDFVFVKEVAGYCSYCHELIRILAEEHDFKFNNRVVRCDRDSDGDFRFFPDDLREARLNT